MCKWLMDQMRAGYINKKHHFSESSLFDAVILHHAVSYDPTLRHVDLYGKVNGDIFYHHFVTGNNTSTLHFYQVWEKDGSINDQKVKMGYFLYKHLYNPFTHMFGLEDQFDRRYVKIYTKDYRNTNINTKKGYNDLFRNC